MLFGDGVNEVECFALALRDLGDVGGPGVGLGAEEGAAGVVEDYVGVVVEKDGALVEARPRGVE
jgi:hypothetical protein